MKSKLIIVQCRSAQLIYLSLDEGLSSNSGEMNDIGSGRRVKNCGRTKETNITNASLMGTEDKGEEKR